VLIEIGGEEFNIFSESLYKARNELDLKDQFQAFVLYLKCHKLYEKHEVKNFHQDIAPVIMKCCHIEFSNSSYH